METQIRKSVIVRVKRTSLEKPIVADIIKRLARILSHQKNVLIDTVDFSETGLDFVEDKVSIRFMGY